MTPDLLILIAEKKREEAAQRLRTAPHGHVSARKRELVRATAECLRVERQAQEAA